MDINENSLIIFILIFMLFQISYNVFLIRYVKKWVE